MVSLWNLCGTRTFYGMTDGYIGWCHSIRKPRCVESLQIYPYPYPYKRADPIQIGFLATKWLLPAIQFEAWRELMCLQQTRHHHSTRDWPTYPRVVTQQIWNTGTKENYKYMVIYGVFWGGNTGNYLENYIKYGEGGRVVTQQRWNAGTRKNSKYRTIYGVF